MHDSSSKTKSQYETLLSYELKKAAEKGQEQIDIPDWHKDIVRLRIANYKNNPDQAVDYLIAEDDIEKVL